MEKHELIEEVTEGEVVDSEERYFGKQKIEKKVNRYNKISKISVFVSATFVGIGTLLSITCMTIYFVMLGTGLIFFGLFADKSGTNIAIGALSVIILFSVGVLLIGLGILVGYIGYRLKRKAIKLTLELI